MTGGYPSAPPFPGPASSRGWGPGWPNCQTSKIVTVRQNGLTLPMRAEVAELVGLLVKETERLGYDMKVGWCWGFSCRAISGTSTPSNHSWGLAVDINAPVNPYTQPRKTDIPPRIVELWWEYGFYWGGWYGDNGGPSDSMHFEFVKTPAEARSLTARARASLGRAEFPQAGEKSNRVRKAQRRLNRMGFECGTPDGEYGQKTRMAVLHFERAVSYLADNADGKGFERLSWGTLWHPRISTRFVQPGKSGFQVRVVQAALNAVLHPSPGFRASGHFDDKTVWRWKEWQHKQGAKADGVPHERGLRELGERYGFTVKS